MSYLSGMLIRQLLEAAGPPSPFKRPKGVSDFAVGVFGDRPKDWTTAPRWKAINHAVHSSNFDDDSFASMNQIVYGQPPLRTAGVNGCTVMAGEFQDGMHFLAHMDSFEVNGLDWISLLVRGKGGSQRREPYAGAKTVLILCPHTREEHIRKTLETWSKPHPTVPSYKLGLERVTITPYQFGEIPTTHGYSITYDGQQLISSVEPKPWD